MYDTLPAGTVTLLFTDIEGSTRLLHQIGPEAYSRALADHRRALREAFAAYGGVEVDAQGDALFVAFPTADGAAGAATAGQEALAHGPIRVRMGLHTGTPTVTADGYVGQDVHRGARVAALAHGGQVILTETTRSLLPHDTELLDLGVHRLKDIGGGVRLLQLGAKPFPPLRTPGAVDLPLPATRFLGRERELFDAVTMWLEREPRVLTVVGPGGAGKTRFALELARLLAEDADGGTVFVALAPLRDPALVLAAVAERLGAPTPDAEAIAMRVGGRRTHVVVDNIEHLLPEAARPLAELVAATSELRLLVTSREPLRIEAETELDLPPMDEDDGVSLFLERAHAIKPDLPDTPTVHVLVRRLDGLPLALELAASRTKLLSPEQLLARLGHRLDVLKGSRDTDERHATLRATIAWSYDLLDATERDVFARLAVFRGGFALETAEDVCSADLDTVASLLDKSLLRRRTDPDGAERLWMLETIREYARERLAEQPELEAEVHRRHAARVRDIASSARLSSEDQGRVHPDHGRAQAEREEIRTALDWATEHDPVLAAEIVVSLEGYWVTSERADASQRVNALLDNAQPLPPALRAKLLRLRGGLLILLGDLEQGLACYRESLELFREVGDGDNVVALMGRFAVHAGYASDPREARRIVAEVRAANETIGNPAIEPQLLSTLGQVAHREGDLQSALEQYGESVEAAKACGFQMWALWMLDSKLDVELELGLVDDAEQTGREGLALATRLDDLRLTRSLLSGLALVALRRDDMERAGALWKVVADAELDAPVLTLHPEYTAFIQPLETCVNDRFLAGVETGSSLAIGQAVDLALAERQTVP